MDSSPLLVVGAWLLTYLLHSSVLLGVTGLVTGVAPRFAARVAETMWRVALFGGVLTASAALLLSSMSARLQYFEPIGASASYSLSAQRVLGLDGASGAAFMESVATVVAIAVAVWLAIAVLRTFVLLRAHREFRRVLAGRAPLQEPSLLRRVNSWCANGMGEGRVRLSVSSGINTPMVVAADEVCLPACVLQSFTSAELDAALAHEVAHLVRRDRAWLLLSAIVERVLFLQPLNRLAVGRLRTLAELACDDWALQRTRNPIALASALTHVTGWISRGRAYALTVGMASHYDTRDSLAVARVRRILDPAATRLVETRARIRVSFAAMALTTVVLLVPHVSPAAVSGRQAASLLQPLPLQTINAHDDAGPFTLTMQGREVVSATIDGEPVAASRIRHEGNRVRISAENGAVLDLTLTESGGISWTSRPAQLALGR